MRDDVFEKFGLSEARRANKNRVDLPATPSKFTIASTPQRTASKGVCHHRLHSPNPPQFTDQQPKNQLERTIDYLRECSQRRCGIKEHDGAKIRYVCLQDSCKENLGCAHCFLHSHVGHAKAEAEVCIRDLQDLNRTMQMSYEKITTSKLHTRDQILQEIDMEINNLINDFHSSIQFLKNKAIKEIDGLLQSSALLTALKSAPQKPSEEELITELIRLDFRGIERDLFQQLNNAEHQKVRAIPVIKIFQEMNSAMGRFMAEFKKCFPKLHPYPYEGLFSSSESARRRESAVEGLETFDEKQMSPVALESPHFPS